MLSFTGPPLSWRLLALTSLALLLAGCTVRGDDDDEEYEGDDPGECSDGADNDRDGLYDCEDDDCAGAPACAGDDDDATGDDDDATGDDDDSTGGDDDDATADGAYIYAHTATALYSVNPNAPYDETLIGNFSGMNGFSQGVTDLAVDLLGEMWAVGFFEIYEANSVTAALTERTFDLGFGEMNAMTFLANGQLLAGAGSTLYEVDVTTGAASVILTLPTYYFAGDMVGLPNGLLYMLMCVGTTPPCSTSLVTMDLTTMETQEIGPTGFGDMYGVAYHNTNGLIYGFTAAGQVLLIDPATGVATEVKTGGPQWWGATTNPARWSG
jgi:hypothetical protein